jgi:hypothetical protein
MATRYMLTILGKHQDLLTLNWPTRGSPICLRMCQEINLFCGLNGWLRVRCSEGLETYKLGLERRACAKRFGRRDQVQHSGGVDLSIHVMSNVLPFDTCNSTPAFRRFQNLGSLQSYSPFPAYRYPAICLEKRVNYYVSRRAASRGPRAKPAKRVSIGDVKGAKLIRFSSTTERCCRPLDTHPRYPADRVAKAGSIPWPPSNVIYTSPLGSHQSQHTAWSAGHPLEIQSYKSAML